MKLILLQHHFVYQNVYGPFFFFLSPHSWKGGLVPPLKNLAPPVLKCPPCIYGQIWPPLRANAPPEKFPTQLPPLKWEVPKFHLPPPPLIPAGAIHYGCPFILREMHCSPTTPLILNSNKTNNTQFLL